MAATEPLFSAHASPTCAGRAHPLAAHIHWRRTSTGGAHPQAGDIHSNVPTRTCPALHAASGSWSPAHIGGEVLAREGGTGGDELGRCALEDDAAAVVAGAGAEVDDPVGMRHDRLVVRN